MKLYLMIGVFLIGAIAVFGISAPTLISSADTIYVFSGFGLIFVTLPVLFMLGKKIIKEIKEKIV